MKRILALLLVLVLALTAFVGCNKKDDDKDNGGSNNGNNGNTDGTTDDDDETPSEKSYSLAIGVVTNENIESCAVTETVAVIVTDKDGKVVLCRLDCIDYDMAECEDEAPLSKVAQGDDYDPYGVMAAGDWYVQSAFLESYVVGKTQSEIALLAGADGKAADAALKAGCTIGITDLLAAIDKAFESEHKVSFKSTASAFTAGLSVTGSVGVEEDEGFNVSFTVDYAAAILAGGKVVAGIIDTAEVTFVNVAVDEDDVYSAEEFDNAGTKREQGDDYDAWAPMAAGRWYQQVDAYAAAAKGLTKDNIASLASSGVAGCTIYAGGYHAAIVAAVNGAR